MKDDHIACLPYACLLGKNSLPARKQCIVVVGIAAGIKSKNGAEKRQYILK
jgi:hypothetical protein